MYGRVSSSGSSCTARKSDHGGLKRRDFGVVSARRPGAHLASASTLASREMVMQIAITGATGFLGRYLVRQFVRAGHRLRCWYRPGSDRGGFEDVAQAIEWLPGHLGDHAAAGQLVRGVLRRHAGQEHEVVHVPA